jgi:hypothetical protein
LDDGIHFRFHDLKSSERARFVGDRRAEVHLDGPATNELATIMTEMWVTEAGPHNHTDRVDHASKSKSLEPPAGGLVFRLFRLPPASAFAGMTEEQREQRIAEVFASMNAAHTRRDVSKGPRFRTH